MKILFLITKGEVGGAQVSVLNLAGGLKRKGHDVEVCFGPGDFLDEGLSKAGIVRLRSKNLERSHNPFKSLSFIRELKETIDRRTYDIVHFNSSNTLPGVLACKLSRTRPKSVFTFRGLSMVDPNYHKGSVLQLLYFFYFKILLYFVDMPVFVSKANAHYAKQKRITNRGIMIYNGLDPSDIFAVDKNEAIARLERIVGRSLSNVTLLGSIARLDYAKNHEFVINSFHHIRTIDPDAVYVIIGDGPEKARLRAAIQAKKLQNHIVLAGSIEHAVRYISAFLVFCLPSRYEGLSITLIEALMTGTPCLVSNVGGNPEMFDNDPDQIFCLNDDSGFRKKLKNLLNDSELRSRKSKENRERAARFSLSHTIDRYERLYRSLLRRHR